MTAPRIFLSAGEPSGDLHGARLAEALKARWPHAQLFGLGGPRMEAAGVRLLAHVDELAVMGFVEVLRHLPFFVRLMSRVKSEIAAHRPDLVIPIDYPGFNLRLAAHARSSGIPVLYYIAPQVWAWHRSRMAQLARDTDRLAVILPFEEALFRAAGAHAHFVGHPLTDQPPPPLTRAEFLEPLGVDPARPVLALFPGSRNQEVRRHLELFTATMARLHARHRDVQPVIAASGAVEASAWQGVRYPLTPDGWSLLHAADAALVKSGTGTLQAALAGTPLVVMYRVHPLTFMMARRLVDVPHVGLVNLVAGERVAPELLQDDASPEALAAALAPLLEQGSEERRRAIEGLQRVRTALTPPVTGVTAAEQVAGLAAELIEGSG